MEDVLNKRFSDLLENLRKEYSNNSHLTLREYFDKQEKELFEQFQALSMIEINKKMEQNDPSQPKIT